MIKRLTSTHIPAPLGSYAAATQIGSVLFTSGQLPLSPESTAVPEGIIAQTKQVMTNLNHVLVDNGTSFDHVAKTTVYINDLKLLASFDQVYRTYFHDGYPARTAVLVSELPAQALLEVDMVAEVRRIKKWVSIRIFYMATRSSTAIPVRLRFLSTKHPRSTARHCEPIATTCTRGLATRPLTPCRKA